MATAARPKAKDENTNADSPLTPEETTLENTAEGGENTATDTNETPPAREAAPAALEPMHILADRHRVPTWQQAALMRFMGWESGKQATDAEYTAALTRLQNRPIGGGRME